LKYGSARYLSNGEYNFKNPACYSYPATNKCAPGDHFKEYQSDQLDDFLSYKAYKFQLPTYQIIANYLSLISWILVVLGLVVFCGKYVSNSMFSFFKKKGMS
jgi:hypothetical protein